MRRENSSVDTPDSCREKDEESPPVNGTNLETADSSIDESASEIPSTTSQSGCCEQEKIDATVGEENRDQKTIYNKTFKKGKEKERSKED